jgi:hypothetical protein
VINDAHLHLLVNHIPIVGGALVMLLLVVALAGRSAAMTRVALAFTVLIALGTIPAYLSGEGAEEIVEHDDPVAADRIERHEERAERAAIGMWVAGGLGLIGLLAGLRGRAVPRWASLGTLVLLIATNGLLAWAAHAGGQISHPETRAGFVPPTEHRHGPGEAHEAPPAEEAAGAAVEEPGEPPDVDRAPEGEARDDAARDHDHDHGGEHPH